MLRWTDTEWAPWHVAVTDDKKRGRLNIITHLLGQVPYEPLAPKDVSLPKRRIRQSEPAEVSARLIPTPF
jgi:hypothetical protein